MAPATTKFGQKIAHNEAMMKKDAEAGILKA
jgi:hypothetical protein